MRNVDAVFDHASGQISKCNGKVASFVPAVGREVCWKQRGLPAPLCTPLSPSVQEVVALLVQSCHMSVVGTGGSRGSIGLDRRQLEPVLLAVPK